MTKAQADERRLHERRANRATTAGIAAHAVVAEALSAGTVPSGTQLLKMARRHLVDVPGPARLGLAQQVATCVSRYLRFERPPGPWRFIGAEIRLGSGRVDLVWAAPDGRVLIDELKTGSGFILTSSVTQQLVRYAADGRDVYGHAFAGVRCVLPFAPDRSLFVDASGRCTPLAHTVYAFAGGVEVGAA